MPHALPVLFLPLANEITGQNGGDAAVGATVWRLAPPRRARVQGTASPGNVSERHRVCSVGGKLWLEELYVFDIFF